MTPPRTSSPWPISRHSSRARSDVAEPADAEASRLKVALQELAHVLPGPDSRRMIVAELMTQVGPHRPGVVEGVPDSLVDVQLHPLAVAEACAQRGGRPVVR